MEKWELIRRKITALYHTDPVIHITILQARPKVELQDCPMTIRGVYENLFRVEDKSTGYPKFYTFQYVDVMTGRVRIRELEQKVPAEHAGTN